jgi:hypothetical protein
VRLTRRDRAALVLSYELLRSHDAHDCEPFYALGCAADGGVAWLVEEAAHVAYSPHGYRLLRARLALVIRALLRADAGDYGPPGESPVMAWLVHRHGHNGAPPESFAAWRVRHGARWSRRITPLWELAREAGR